MQHAQPKPDELARQDDGVHARLKFELALALAARRGAPLEQVIRQAVAAAGGELILTLPLPDPALEGGETAVLRVRGASGPRFFAVSTADGGFTLAEAPHFSPALLSLARSAADVLQRIKADPSISFSAEPASSISAPR